MFDESPVPDFMRWARLDGQVVVVLGAGQYIGRQTAHALAQAGAKVVCVGRGAEATERVAREVGGLAFIGDATHRPDMERLFADTKEKCGRVDGVVDILGTAVRKGLTELSDEDWQRQFDLILRHAFLTVQIGGPALAANGGGSIVLTSSVAGNAIVRDKSAPGYAVAKAALNHLMRVAAYEFGPQGVRVNAVSLALTQTPRYEHPDERWWEATRRQYPLRRIGQMADAAAANLFLMSQLSAHVTGHLLQVDGGLTIQSPSPFAPLDDPSYAPPPPGSSTALARGEG